MEWYYYFSDFWAGMFLANFVPHFINGISGDAFPTPFAKPPGRGLSSPVVNVLWGLFNLLLAYFLFRLGKVSPADNLTMILFFVGISCMSILLARNFIHKHKA